MANYQLNQPGATIQEAIDIALRIQTDLSSETAAREAADALLASKTELQAEAARAQAAEALLATITSLNAEIERATGVEDALQSLIDAIEERIPSSASASNQLADKAFVNSSIATATAEFRGTYNSLAELQAVSADENDYGYVRTTDAAGNTIFKRYKYASGSWVFEYDLNNSSFTASQWAAINSAITAELVEKLRALPTNAALTELLNGKQGVIHDLDTIRSNAAAGGTAYQKPAGGIPKSDMSVDVQTSLGKADSAVQDVSGKADKTELEALAEEVAKKANVEGYYGGLTAGSAENLVGRGSVEAEIHGIRTSAGQEDIGTGAAIIREVRGKSLVWNQLVPIGSSNRSITKNGVTITDNRDGSYTIVTDSGGATANVDISVATGTRKHSKFLLLGGISSSVPLFDAWAVQYDTGSGKIYNSYSTGAYDIRIRVASGAIITFPITLRPRLFDISLMFGAGNEPATPEEFERMFQLPYYGYKNGIIINNEATGLRTRGFNLFNPVTGKAVLPGKYSDYPYEYEICGAFTSISFEDYAGNVSTPELSDGRFFNVDAPGVLTVVGGNATDTCVHLVWSGWRNYGEPDYVYEPYWENTLPLNIKTITGKLNGEGESVVIFPNGMRGAGTAYDRLIVDPDGFARRAIVAMGSVDMGTLTWDYDSQYSVFLGGSLSAKAGLNCASTKYSTANVASSAAKDKSVYLRNVSRQVVGVKDSSYTSAADFQSAMSGVELVYELATPREYVLDTPIPLTYMVDDFGTEAKLPVDTAQLPTGPLRFAVTYPFNAVDKLRRLSTNYLSKESTEAMLNALQSAGIIGGYTMSYNATTEQYTFTITPPSTTPDETTD